MIQVSYDVSNPKTLKREILALTEAAGELRCENLLLITWDEERQIEENSYTINVTPLWKWFLEETVV